METKKVNVRQFNRNMYFYLSILPIIVYNKKTNKDLFKVVKVKSDDEKNVQPNK